MKARLWRAFLLFPNVSLKLCPPQAGKALASKNVWLYLNIEQGLTILDFRSFFRATLFYKSEYISLIFSLLKSSRFQSGLIVVLKSISLYLSS